MTGVPSRSPFSWTASVLPSAVWTVRSIIAPSGVMASVRANLPERYAPARSSGVVDARQRRQRAGPVPGEAGGVGPAEKPGQQVRLRAADLNRVRRIAAQLVAVTGVGRLQPGRLGRQVALVQGADGHAQHLVDE